MSALLWRVILAVLAVLILFALLPPVFRVIGLSLSGDVWLILRICIGGMAAFYIAKGPPFPA